MNAFDTAVKFFQDCGLFIYPSIAIMTIGLAIAIERFIFLNRARSQNRKVWAQVKPMLEGGKFKEVQGVTAQSDAAIGQDRADIDRSQIVGNRELPKVLYIVPWKKPLPGELSGRPVHSVLDEALAAIDRDVFRRQLRYDAQLQPSAATTAAPAK